MLRRPDEAGAAVPVSWRRSRPSQSKATGQPGLTRESSGRSCWAWHWYRLTWRVLGVVLGLGVLWVGLVVLVLILGFAAIARRLPIRKIWSADMVATSMVVVWLIHVWDKENGMETIRVSKSIVVLSQSRSFDGQVSVEKQAPDKHARLEVHKRHHCPPSSRCHI